jgi:Fe(3+) dicitrate transport protein
VLVALLPSVGLAQEKKTGKDDLPKNAEDPTGDAPAAAIDPDTLQIRLSERVNVIGDADRARDLPGSAYFIDRREMELRKQGFDDVHRMLRQVPGIAIQEEEGFGLRPNIGLRGSGTERSSKITLMEDGVLIAPAPYAAPAAYYFPTAGRMDALEVRKGSSQIKFGPRTNGGVLNLISRPVPPDLRIGAHLGLGEHQSRKVAVTVGDSYAHFGWNFETYQMRTDGYKRVDGGGDSGFDLQDYVSKFRFHTSAQSKVFQELELKLGYSEQLANETYLGLTDEDFRASGLRRYAGSRQDELKWEHRQYQIRHFLALPRGLDLTTVVYRNDFHRNWYKLDSVGGVPLPDLFEDPLRNARGLGIVRGADSAIDELQLRANNRTYYSQGVQTALGLQFGGEGPRHSLEMGFRFHQDQEDRFQHQDGYQMLNGRMNLTRRGAPGSQSNRVSDARAVAFFLQDEIRSGRLRLLPGFRFESVDFVRRDYRGSDPERLLPAARRRNSVDALIPGMGLTFDWTPELRVFAGVHRGFSPPGPGADDATQPEGSVNYEVGLRSGRGGFHYEAVFFYNDYQNLLGADTLSSGGTGEGDLFNGGRARAVGWELAARADLGRRLGTGWALPVRLSYTLTDATFRNSFESGFEPWGSVEAGDRLPYLARHQLYGSLVLERGRWLLGLDAAYTSAMRTRAGQGPLPQAYSTDAALIWNLSGEHALSSQARLFVSVQNLTDERYVVARAPAGARPGLPRTLMAGIRFLMGS